MPGRPVMFVMVGLPAAGKTTRAKELAERHAAVRLTPDEWMIPLFGQVQPDGVRNLVEGRLLWVALSALGVGTSVVLDFGVWAREERMALRALATSAGAGFELVYLPIDEGEQWRRVQARTGSPTSFEMTRADLDGWRPLLQVPLADELAGVQDPPPAGSATWREWVGRWWPTAVDDR